MNMRVICRLVVLLVVAIVSFHSTESAARDVVFGNISIHPTTNLHSKSDRAAAAIKISDYLLKDPNDSLRALPRPSEALMQMYQKKKDYMDSLSGANMFEQLRISEELEDAKAMEILRYHAPHVTCC